MHNIMKCKIIIIVTIVDRVYRQLIDRIGSIVDRVDRVGNSREYFTVVDRVDAS